MNVSPTDIVLVSFMWDLNSKNLKLGRYQRRSYNLITSIDEGSYSKKAKKFLKKYILLKVTGICCFDRHDKWSKLSLYPSWLPNRFVCRKLQTKEARYWLEDLSEGHKETFCSGSFISMQDIVLIWKTCKKESTRGRAFCTAWLSLLMKQLVDFTQLSVDRWLKVVYICR